MANGSEDVGKLEPSALLVGMKNDNNSAAVENGMVVLKHS